MSDATDLLEAGELELQAQFLNTFTVEGRSDSFRGLLDTANFSEELTTAGMRGTDSAILGFLKSAGYAPEVGDEIEVAGVKWKVASVRGGSVKWEVTLISDDE